MLWDIIKYFKKNIILFFYIQGLYPIDFTFSVYVPKWSTVLTVILDSIIYFKEVNLLQVESLTWVHSLFLI